MHLVPAEETDLSLIRINSDIGWYALVIAGGKDRNWNPGICE